MTRRGLAGDRLLETAAGLFYRHGVVATGVDTVAARSGVSKPTLYKVFGSKDDLVLAVLERRHERRRATFEADLEARGSTPSERILAVFDWLGDWFAEPDFRGCAFINAAVELSDPAHPVHEVVRQHKRWTQDCLTRLAEAASFSDPQELASELMLLVDGAIVTAMIGRDPAVAARARRAAARLLAVHGRETTRRSPSGGTDAGH